MKRYHAYYMTEEPDGPLMSVADHERALRDVLDEVARLEKAVAAVVQPPHPPSLPAKGLEIVSGWLVERSTDCTCSPYGSSHEPHCGLTPLLNLYDLPGWPDPTTGGWLATLNSIEAHRAKEGP